MEAEIENGLHFAGLGYGNVIWAMGRILARRIYDLEEIRD